MTKFQLYQRGGKPRGVTCVDLNSKSELIFTIVYNKLKNDLRLPLASSVKELESFFKKKLIKSRYFYEPGLNPDRKNETNDGLASKLAMRMASFYSDESLDVWALYQQKRKRMFSQELEQTKKRKPF